MANLIIKPTNGGSLILQDEGGDPAHTIDASGNHTLANATTMANATITAWTPPTGAVVKVSSVYHDNGGSRAIISADATWTEISNNLRLAHQASATTNILLMNFSIPFNSPNAPGLYHCKFYNQGGSADLTLPGASGSRSRVHWTTRVKPHDNNDMFMINMTLRHVAGTVSSVTYSPYFWTSSADIDFFVSDLNNVEGHTAGGTFSIMEIKA